MKRSVPLAICLVMGIVMMIQFFVPHPASVAFYDLTTKWIRIVGAFALDKWLCNCDGRQVLFCRREQDRNFRAHFIDFGYCFNAEEWTFPDATARGICARRHVYQNVCGWKSFDPWLSRIESFDLLKLWEIAADVPPEWVDPERLAQVVECIDARRNRVRELIAAVRRSPHNPFGSWMEGQP